MTTYAQMTLPEFEHEMATTRKMLERVPEDKLDWKPHEKSNTIGWNANHLAEIPGWGANILSESFYDMNPPGGKPYKTPAVATRAELLSAFDAGVAEAREALKSITDEQADAIWSFKSGGETMLEMPKRVAFRMWVISHAIHHRAILSVYYRLNDVPVPAIYGPSADEME